MKVISQDGGLASLIFIADEVKPLKGYHLPKLLEAVAQRYNATKAPTLVEARGAGGAAFENCLFNASDKQIAIGRIDFHNDAIVVMTTDTDDSEIVLDDIFQWLKQEFQFRDPISTSIKRFQSDLVVSFDHDPSDSFSGIGSFIKHIQDEMMPRNAHTKKDLQFAHITFATDPLISGPSPEFSVTHRFGVPWRYGLYFSKAHMRTQSHIRSLEMLDGMLAKKS